jgi:hypothetical protein
MKIKIEWHDEELWRAVMVQLSFSSHGNWTFKHDGRVYVFKEKRQGEEVLVLESGKWVKAGRVTRNCVFLGPGISSDEFYQTPEGMKSAKAAFDSFLAQKKEAVYGHG